MGSWMIALAAGAFCIGMTEFLPMGLLPDIAHDLDVSIPATGNLVTVYALGVVIGGPLMVALTINRPRKATLLGLMAIFTLGNMLCALAPNYLTLAAARIFTALSHGSFFGIAAVVALYLAPPGQGNRALALMFTGLTMANVLGVPLGTLLGQETSWRIPFWTVSVCGAVALYAIWRFIHDLSAMPRPDIRREMRAVLKPSVLLAMAITAIGFAGVFTIFTYITPILEDMAGLSPRNVSAMLVAMGIAATIGLNIGGKMADWKLLPTIAISLTGMALLGMLFAWSMQFTLAAVLTAFAWGMVSFAVGPGLQTNAMAQAGDSPLMASTVNQSAFNLGNAGGAFLGGAVIHFGFGLPAVALASAAVAVCGALLTVYSMRHYGKKNL
ncbi:MFS transporter [Methylobacillus flagellatus]|uniref:Major facilitator superfamily MFS_1 n=1 Tax=Methylobacillus flagellatus (strain ATCC 51484 / DSM 6875 / VKM B-1610 / KT) TaxID=265072 RepID=Q1H218_METFK|nr:MFS transporter [Methylobacillus flagellatus]ABE49469.1 major facilitator superfamily MFS_1 [Methylobacillus flagellatus KT]